jgi:PleD family two-component response regulator
MQRTSSDQAWRSPRRNGARSHVARGNPLILVIEAGEWTGRALEQALAARGYTVCRAASGRNGIAHARASNPAAILVDVQLSDMPAPEVCRTLAADPVVGATTPIFVAGPDDYARRLRLEALRAGAWGFIALPPVVDEVVAQLNTVTRAKRAADAMRSGGLLDEPTGLYNLQGMLRRAEELGAAAARQRHPLACIAFVLPHEPHSPGHAPETLVSACAALRDAVRASDVLGRIARAQFAVIAPETDGDGARRLAARALRAFDRISSVQAGHDPTEPMGAARAGFCALMSEDAAAVTPEELLGRALGALQLDQPGGTGEERIRQYTA